MKSSKHPPFVSDPTGREHALTGEVITVGRAIENDIVITSKRVSRGHARLRREGWRVILEDLGSTNGTFLNGERLSAPVDLRDGDQLGFGDVVLVFHDPNVTYQDTPFPELALDVAAGSVWVDRHPVSLSGKEFALLAYLHEHRGLIRTKDDIAAAVWPEYEREGVYDYQIENLVRRLRSKIELDARNPQLLVTVRGMGYKLTVET
jgi:DNA-binding response OmpR family regulator